MLWMTSSLGSNPVWHVVMRVMDDARQSEPTVRAMCGHIIRLESVRQNRCDEPINGRCCMCVDAIKEWSDTSKVERLDVANEDFAIRLLRRFVDHFMPKQRWPCGECGRKDPYEPLRTNVVRMEDGVDQTGKCSLCSANDLFDLADDFLSCIRPDKMLLDEVGEWLTHYEIQGGDLIRRITELGDQRNKLRSEVDLLKRELMRRGFQDFLEGR